MAQGKEYTAEQKDSIVKSLLPYLEMGFSRNKACELIGLTPQTLSVWVKNDEALLIKLQGAENMLNALAISNIASAMQLEAETQDTRKETSKWWLERKMKQDFSARTEQTGPDGKELPTPIISLNAIRRDNSLEEDSEPR